MNLEPFLSFCVERHRIWEKRQAGEDPPWTADPILAARKFTNTFRILDPGTQFLMTDLFEPDLDTRNALMRAFLYRHTGRIETWRYLDLTTGYPTVDNLEDVRQAWRAYSGPFFTNAYIVYPQSNDPGTTKLDAIVNAAARLFTPGSPDDIMPEWERAETQEQRFKLLRRNKGTGDFMSQQVLIDWSYCQDVDLEDEFLVPGPGSVKGAKALDSTAKPSDTVRRAVEAVRGLPHCPRVGYRVPSLMDIGSNLLCEWSKYARYRDKPIPAKTYQPAHPGPQPEPVLPSYYGADLL